MTLYGTNINYVLKKFFIKYKKLNAVSNTLQQNNSYGTSMTN